MAPIVAPTPGGLIALGIIVGLVSTSVQSLGLTLQRKSHILEDEKGPHDVRRPPHLRRRWQIGMGMFVLSNLVGSSVQIGTLPLPVLSTLQASGLVFNSICATLILGEPFTRWSLAGTILVSTGAILIGIFGAIPSPTHTLNELLALFARRPFIIWMSLQAVFIATLCVVTDVFSHLSGLSHSPRFRFIRGLSYGGISGMLSAHSLLMAKSTVELIIKTAVKGENQFNRWQSWMIVVALVVLALSQLYYLHRGLKLVSTSVLYPLVFCIYNIIAILDGLIYFDQTNLITPLQAGLIALGTAILLAGVLALSWRLSDEQHQPAVGQSTLAPGLGLVEDTDGEEEEGDLLLGSNHASSDEESLLTSRTKNYQTFATKRKENGHDSSASILTPKKQGASPRWNEHIEIWDELHDEDEPYSPTITHFTPRHRSKTMPALQGSSSTLSSPGLRSNRKSLGGTTASRLGLQQPRASASSDQISSPGFTRKRRRSTGFPGFSARKHTRQSSGGLQETLGGIWNRRWWRNKGSRPGSARTHEEGVGGGGLTGAIDSQTEPMLPISLASSEAAATYKDIPAVLDEDESSRMQTSEHDAGHEVLPLPIQVQDLERAGENTGPRPADESPT